MTPTSVTPSLFTKCLARSYLSQSNRYHYLPLVLANYKVVIEVNVSNTIGLVAGPFSLPATGVTGSKSYSYNSNVFSFSNVSYFPAGL